MEQRHSLEISAMKLYYTGEESNVPTCRVLYDGKSVNKTIAGVSTVVDCMEHREYGLPERTAKFGKEWELQAYCDRRD